MSEYPDAGNARRDQPANPPAADPGAGRPTEPVRDPSSNPTLPLSKDGAGAGSGEQGRPPFVPPQPGPAYGQPGGYGGPDPSAPPYGFQAGAAPGQPYPQQAYGQQPYGAPYGGPGQPYYTVPGYVEQKSRLVGGLLGILLGGLGIHRFYLGYTTIGVLQIVVTFLTFGVGALWGFIEGIMILVGAEPFRRDARGIPLKE
jgi:hypothetical protein